MIKTVTWFRITLGRGDVVVGQSVSPCMRKIVCFESIFCRTPPPPPSVNIFMLLKYSPVGHNTKYKLISHLEYTKKPYSTIFLSGGQKDNAIYFAYFRYRTSFQSKFCMTKNTYVTHCTYISSMLMLRTAKFYFQKYT